MLRLHLVDQGRVRGKVLLSERENGCTTNTNGLENATFVAVIMALLGAFNTQSNINTL